MKGSKWGSREVRNRAANGEVEVLCKLMREGLDEKLDLWLEIAATFRFSRSTVSCRQLGVGTGELSCGIWSP